MDIPAETIGQVLRFACRSRSGSGPIDLKLMAMMCLVCRKFREEARLLVKQTVWMVMDLQDEPDVPEIVRAVAWGMSELVSGSRFGPSVEFFNVSSSVTLFACLSTIFTAKNHRRMVLEGGRFMLICHGRVFLFNDVVQGRAKESGFYLYFNGSETAVHGGDLPEIGLKIQETALDQKTKTRMTVIDLPHAPRFGDKAFLVNVYFDCTDGYDVLLAIMIHGDLLFGTELRGSSLENTASLFEAFRGGEWGCELMKLSELDCLKINSAVDEHDQINGYQVNFDRGIRVALPVKNGLFVFFCWTIASKFDEESEEVVYCDGDEIVFTSLSLQKHFVEKAVGAMEVSGLISSDTKDTDVMFHVLEAFEYFQ